MREITHELYVKTELFQARISPAWFRQGLALMTAISHFTFGGGLLTAATARPRVCVGPRHMANRRGQAVLTSPGRDPPCKLGRGAMPLHGVPALLYG